ncbi:MAG TPA: hypothetical protein VFW29_10560 [Solirubrobacteraceae bacterium]|nr:hypothetical protein [Solirubrobacteraceae bacterium]
MKRTARSSLLACAALAAAGTSLLGCGSSSKSSTTSATSTPAPAQATGAQSTPTSTSGAGSANGAAAVAACKQAIQAQTTLSSDDKHKLEGLCAKAANGNEAEIRQAAKAICEEVINKSAIPAGPAREQALQACRKP